MYRTSKQQALELDPGLICERRNTKPLSKRPDYLYIVWQAREHEDGGGWLSIGVGYSGGGAWDSALKKLNSGGQYA